MADDDPFETQLLAEMRANDGDVISGPLAGHPLLVMTSRGAKSNEDRRAILTYHRDGDDFIVAGTAGGAASDPAWLRNVEADEHVTIEVRSERSEAKATIVEGAERDRVWADHVKALPWLADYPAQTGRLIPMVRLTRTSAPR